VRGTGAFLGALPVGPLDVKTLGMRVTVTDLGSGGAVILDHAIPGGLVPTVCGPKDGWKTNASGTSQRYANLSDRLPPSCVYGSARGIVKARATDKTAAGHGVQHKVRGKNGTYGPVNGPVRVTIAYGGAAESLGGQCSEVIFTAEQCVLNASGTTLRCK
jgi:hypothetical protein